MEQKTAITSPMFHSDGANIGLVIIPTRRRY